MTATNEKPRTGERLALKSVIISVLVLILWIATLFIQNMIDERQLRQQEAIDEVSSKWGRRQTVTGPVLTIPYLQFEKSPDPDRNGAATWLKVTRYAHFLPESLEIQGAMSPEKRYRGIFEVVVYNSALSCQGKFKMPDLASLNVPKENILLNEAFVSVGLSDLRGIEKEIALEFDKSSYPMNPGLPSRDVLEKGVSAPIRLSEDSTKKEFEFSLALQLKGSESLYFTPLGKETSIHVSAPWSTPSFDGAYLPDARTVTDTSFTAGWNVLHLNREYPQSWKGSAFDVSTSSFGVSLLTPVDNYQKNTRSVKYAIMIILLSFVVIFFVEMLSGRMIHPFQYLLIGTGLCIFYSLLLALSEHVGFNLSYFISSAATVGLITFYARSVFRDVRLSWMMCGVLVLLHSFMFSLIQMEDHSLLMGSIGLFLVIALLMYSSRKIDWYTISKSRSQAA